MAVVVIERLPASDRLSPNAKMLLKVGGMLSRT